MVNKSLKSGSVLAIILFILVIMLLLAVTLNQIMVGQMRAINNSSDVMLAQNYAKLALLAAEQTVYDFDDAAKLDNKTPTERYNDVLNKSGSTYNIVTNGTSCNAGGIRAGWCYKALTAVPHNSDPTWQPWLESEEVTMGAFPCSSYTASKNANDKNYIPKIDEKFTSAVGVQVYNSGNTSLCAQPRYIIEPLQLDFRGFLAPGQSTNPIRGKITQNNGVTLWAYESASSNATSSRLYRITVRAFGKNGDTRVTLQEIVVIANNTKYRNVDDSNNLPAHNITPLSLRWLY